MKGVDACYSKCEDGSDSMELWIQNLLYEYKTATF